MSELTIQIASDLHVEHIHQKKVKGLLEMIGSTNSILVLLGDIYCFHDVFTLRSIFEKLSQRYPKILYIPGNHEYYVGVNPKHKNTMGGLLRRAKELTKGTNVQILDNESIIIDNIRVIGSTLWSNIPNNHFDYIACHINDYRSIYLNDDGKVRPLRVEDTVRFHKEAVRFIQRELLESHKNNQKAIVLTHHAPLLYGTSAPEHTNAPGNYAFASNLNYLMGSHVKLWAFGHTHWCCDIMKKGSRVISNARGYPSEPSKKYKDDLVITIDGSE